MLVFLGIIALLISIGLFLYPIIGKFIERELPKFNGRILIAVIMIICSLLLLNVNSMFFYAEPGYSYLVQYVNGTQVAEITPGIKMKWFGQVISFKKVITVKYTDGVKDGNVGKVTKSVMPVDVRFNDAVMATVQATIRVKLPDDPALFIKLANEFRSQDNLVTATIVPVGIEAIRNSARGLSAMEYVTGEGGRLETYVRDQLQYGIYIFEKIPVKNLPSERDEIVQDVRHIDTDNAENYEVIIGRDEEGNIVRKPNSMTDYGLIITQSIIEDVNPEEKFRQLLELQRDAAAQASVAEQKVIQAQREREQVIAEGEKEKAEVKAREEKQQIETLIRAETLKKQQEISLEQEMVKLDQEKIKLQQEQIRAEQITVIAEAEANKRKLEMEADNALQIKLDAYVKIHEAYANSLQGTNLVPDIQIGGSEGSNNSIDVISLLIAKLAQDLGGDSLLSPIQ